MKKYCKIVNNETKQVNVGLGENVEFYKSLGYTLQDVEQDYRGQWYIEGFAPQQPIEELKEEKIRQLDKNCQDYIFIQYPVYKQLNIINPLSEYGSSEKEKMNLFIEEQRDKYNLIKDNINNCKTIEELNNININFMEE